MRWEGKGLGSREWFRSALTTEIAAITGQNIFVSMRSSYGGSLRSVYSNGETIVAKMQARIGMRANLSIIGLERLKGAGLWRPLVLGARSVCDGAK